ncbi:hypothetical protein [Citrobacter werkmanii]|uniref:hypothetical protein n=1 Tax=Citrobacter werkmanii TaxID=67827 RepID=UPI00264CDA5A|nr:hypothetical protein [Citrobacter werkmanii]MDN8558374.1 hypothetical protein [Citrobacter werkmanii]
MEAWNVATIRTGASVETWVAAGVSLTPGGFIIAIKACYTQDKPDNRVEAEPATFIWGRMVQQSQNAGAAGDMSSAKAGQAYHSSHPDGVMAV